MTLKQYQERFDEVSTTVGAFLPQEGIVDDWLGFKHGEDGAAETLRDEIRAELEAELSNPECPMCALRRELRDKDEAIDELERRIQELRDRHRRGVHRG